MLVGKGKATHLYATFGVFFEHFEKQITSWIFDFIGHFECPNLDFLEERPDVVIVKWQSTR